MKLYIGNDHAGWKLKMRIIAFLQSSFTQFAIEDLGTNSHDISVDYPDYGIAVAKQVVQNQGMGILICGSGIGISIAANRIKGARAALCTNPLMAQLAREHNDANILVMGERIISEKIALQCVQTFLTTEFAGGRHEVRIAKIDHII